MRSRPPEDRIATGTGPVAIARAQRRADTAPDAVAESSSSRRPRVLGSRERTKGPHVTTQLSTEESAHEVEAT